MPDSEDIQAPPPPGLGLGERLRSARKARALSVAQVAEALRLEEASVVALEDGRFDAMGAPVFVRGHLKRYARLVGLSQEAVLDAYRTAAPGSDAPPSLAGRRERTDTIRVGSWVYWAAAALLLVAVIIALGDGDEEAIPAAPGAVTAPAEAPAAPVAAPPSAEAPVTGAPADAPPSATSEEAAPTQGAAPSP